MRKLAWVASLLALGLGAMGATGCTRFGSFCTDEMDCRGGNDNDIAACEVELNADVDRTDEWGCTAEFDELFTCREAEAYCDANNNWTTGDGTNDRCDVERNHLNDCCRDFC
jgi:hypothetical protein